MCQTETTQLNDPKTLRTKSTMQHLKIKELKNLVGQSLGESTHFSITQERIDGFANTTLDQQWVHTDPAKAAKYSPFQKTVAHGYLTLSLIPHLMSQVFTIEDAKMALNYGTDKVRFISPVVVDSEIRLHASLIRLENIENGVKLWIEAVVEVKGGSKPACSAEIITLVYG